MHTLRWASVSSVRFVESDDSVHVCVCDCVCVCVWLCACTDHQHQWHSPASVTVTPHRHVVAVSDITLLSLPVQSHSTFIIYHISSDLFSPSWSALLVHTSPSDYVCSTVHTASIKLTLRDRVLLSTVQVHYYTSLNYHKVKWTCDDVCWQQWRVRQNHVEAQTHCELTSEIHTQQRTDYNNN